MKHYQQHHLNLSKKQKKTSFKRIILNLLILITILTLVRLIWILASQLYEKTTNQMIAVNLEKHQPTPVQSTETEQTITTHAPHQTAHNWQRTIVEPGDSLARIFQRLHLSQKTLSEVMQANPLTTSLTKLIPGETISILIDENNELQQLIYSVDPSKDLVVKRGTERLTATFKDKILHDRTVIASSVINNSLYMSAKKIDLPEKIIYQLTSLFSWHIDFSKQLRPGDRFSLIYNELNDDENNIIIGDILAAKFYNKGQSHTTIRYTNASGVTDYYLPTGQNNRKALLRFPVKFTHISSPFNLYRKHPILGEIRPHRGVDLAAALGTPIEAAGDGVIRFIGRNGGYGRMIEIKHSEQYSTLYAHMLRFKKDLYVGSRVKQGEIIGFVGQSGLATGPHLHYEIHKNGQPSDPISVKLPHAQSLDESEYSDFTTHANALINQLQVYESSLFESESESVN